MKIKIFLLLFAAAMPGLFAAKSLAVGRDVPDTPAAESTQVRGLDERSRALEAYIAGLLEKEPRKKMDLFLKAVELDPLRELPVFQLLKTLPRVPERTQEICEKFSAFRQKYPGSFFLALQSAFLSRRAGVPPAVIAENLAPMFEKNCPAGEKRYLHPLAFNYANARLDSGSPCVPALFGRYEADLPDVALLYYTAVRRRELFLRTSSCAEKMIGRYLGILRGTPLKNAGLFRRYQDVLLNAGEEQTAYELAEKWFAQYKDDFGLFLLIRSASKAGKISRLEELFRKYPALSVDFCTREKIQAYLSAGNFARAYQETANLSRKIEQAENRFIIAVRMRKASLALKALAELEKQPGYSKDVIYLKRLAAAEINGEKKILQEAVKYFGGRTMKDPMIANSCGYVSAVVGGDLDQAEKWMSFALSREPDNPAFLDSMAWVLFKKKQFSRAAEYIEKAFRKLPLSLSCAVISDHAGDIYLALGNRENALYYYQLAQQLWLRDKSGNSELDFSALKKKIDSLTSGKRK